MYDRSLAQDSLLNIKEALTTICERMVPVRSVDDFLLSPEGMLRLDAICMNLIALGEAVKGLDKITKGELLASHPEIYWSGIMRMRDKIAHHYFEIDAEVVFNTLQTDIPPLFPVIEKMLAEVSQGDIL